MRPSIASIRVVYSFHTTEQPSKPLEGYETGTGFIVDKFGHIATASHVVNRDHALADVTNLVSTQIREHLDAESFALKAIQVSFPDKSVYRDSRGNETYNNNDVFTGAVAAEDVTGDIAIIKCVVNPVGLKSGLVINGNSRPPAKVPRLQVAPPREGETISVSGFPLSIPVLVTNTGTVASSFFKDEKGRSLYLGSLLINHGDSGGPVYSDSTSAVLGVVVEYRVAPEGNSGLTVIVPIQRVLDLISTIKTN